MVSGFGVWSFKVSVFSFAGVGPRVFGFRVLSFGFRNLGFTVQGLGFWVLGFGLRASGFGCRVQSGWRSLSAANRLCRRPAAASGRRPAAFELFHRQRQAVSLTAAKAESFGLVPEAPPWLGSPAATCCFCLCLTGVANTPVFLFLCVDLCVCVFP